MEETNSYTYFAIRSNSIIGDTGLIATKKGVFDSTEITKMLNIQPDNNWSYGDKRKDGSTYLFSHWDAEKSNVARLDVEAQCIETIRNLKSKIPILRQIKKQFDVKFVLMIVPIVYGEEQPWMSFNKEIIEFCYLTGTTIAVDLYIHPEEEV